MRTRRMLGLLGLGALALSVAAVLSLILGPHGLAVPAQAQGGTALVLDMNADNGNGPCDPIDSNASVGNGSEYKVAVCLTRSSAAPAAFEFFVNNDRSLDQCVPVDCGDTDCLDSNPDANVGNTTWGTSLGTKWSCNFSKLEPPTCDKNGQVVFISCLTLEIPTLPAGLGVTAPLAVMTFKATSEGTDTFSLGPNSVAYDFDTVTLVDCSGSTPCPGGSVTITAAGAPTATIASSPVPGAATATSAAVTANTTPGATSTPGGKATAKPTAAAGEGGGSSGPSAGVIAAIVVGAVIVVGGVGWFGWRRLRAG